MIHQGEDTLRSRAAAAVSRRRLQERLEQQELERRRCAKAHTLIREVLGVVAGVTALPVELDGLEFEIALDGDECLLCLVRPCRSLLDGLQPKDCAEQTAVPIRSLADLGEALKQGPDYCAWCSH